MKLYKRLLFTMLMLIVIVIALLSFLLNSNTGLHLALYFGKQTIPGQLAYKKVRGTLLGPIHIKELRYTDDAQTVEIEQLELQWKLRKLWHKELYIKRIQAERVQIRTATETEQAQARADDQLLWPELPLTIRLQKLKIKKLQINDFAPQALFLSARFDNQRWQIKEAGLNIGDSRLQLKAYVDARAPHQSKATLQFLPDKDAPSSAIEGKLEFRGNVDRYQWQGDFAHPTPLHISGQISNLQNIEGKIKWSAFEYALSPQKTIRMDTGFFSFTGQYPEFKFKLEASQEAPVKSNLQIEGHTDLNSLELEALMKVASGQLHLQVEAGKEKAPYIRGKLIGRKLDLQAFDLPLRIHSLNSSFDTSNGHHATGNIQAHYQQTAFDGQFTLDNDNINARLRQQRNQITLTGKTGYPLAVELLLPQPATLHPALEGLQTAITGQIELNAADMGEARLHIAPGTWQNLQDTSVPPLHFEGGDIRAELSPQGLKAWGKIIVDSAKTLVLDMTLPGFNLTQGADSQQSIEGSLDLRINDLAFVHEISPVIENAKGRLLARLAVSGELAKPVLTGSVQLSQGGMELTTMGIKLDPLVLTIDAGVQDWELQGSAGNLPNQLQFSGKGRFTPQLQGNLKLTGQNFQLINTSEYVIYLSPDLSLQFAGRDYHLGGKITIPKGEIKPHTFTHSVSLTGDAVFVEKTHEKEKALPTQLNTNIDIVMGDDVQLDVKGLTAKVVGDMKVQQAPGGLMTSVGRLSVVDGKYQAYGQDLTIQKGELIFTGAQITNPGINVRATRTFSTTGDAFSGSNRLFDFGASNVQEMSFSNETTVGIAITGQIHTPEMTLFSAPGNLSQADILSMLVLGRPANQASGASGELLLAAIRSMNLGSGTKGVQLLSQLQKAVGLDFSIDKVSTYDKQTNMVQEERRLGVSKSITNRLSLKYNMGLSQEGGNGITLSYLLNRYFHIEITAGMQGSGIDFIYNHQQE